MRSAQFIIRAYIIVLIIAICLFISNYYFIPNNQFTDIFDKTMTYTYNQILSGIPLTNSRQEGSDINSVLNDCTSSCINNPQCYGIVTTITKDNTKITCDLMPWGSQLENSPICNDKYCAVYQKPRSMKPPPEITPPPQEPTPPPPEPTPPPPPPPEPIIEEKVPLTNIDGYTLETNMNYIPPYETYLIMSSLNTQDVKLCEQYCNNNKLCSGFIVDSVNGKQPISKCLLKSGAYFIYGATPSVDTNYSTYKKNKIVPSWVDINKTVPIIYTWYARREGTQYTGGYTIYAQRDSFGSLTSADRYTSYGWFMFYDYYAIFSVYFYVHTTPPSYIDLDLYIYREDSVRAILFKYETTGMMLAQRSILGNMNILSSTKANSGNITYVDKYINKTQIRLKLEEGNTYRLVIQMTNDDDRGGMKFANTAWYTLLNPYVYWQNLSEELKTIYDQSTPDPNGVDYDTITNYYNSAQPYPL